MTFFFTIFVLAVPFFTFVYAKCEQWKQENDRAMFYSYWRRVTGVGRKY
jgi:hypothetical protein